MIGMAINKTYTTFSEAVVDIKDGATIMIGNFAGPGGYPHHLVQALRDHGAKDITIIANTAGGTGLVYDFDDHKILFEAGLVKKMIATFPVATSPRKVSPFEAQYRAGKVELELVPQGTLAERIRAGGAGIPAFYTPTGVGTVVEQGKEKKDFNGRPHLLEYALKADYALIRAYKADTMGNLIYRGTARQFNHIMATAARITIAEVDYIVEPGELDPECIITPGIFVHRLVQIPEEERRPPLLERWKT